MNGICRMKKKWLLAKEIGLEFGVWRLAFISK
jgi:hypothetical protein